MSNDNNEDFIEIDMNNNIADPVEVDMNNNIADPVEVDMNNNNIADPVELDMNNNIADPVELDMNNNIADPGEIDMNNNNIDDPVEIDMNNNIEENFFNEENEIPMEVIGVNANIVNATGTSIDDLDIKCLKEIFKYLNIQEHLLAEAVCEKWKGISTSGWKCIEKLDALSNDYYFGDNSLPQDKSIILETIVIRCGHSLSKLSFDDKCSQRTIDAIAAHCINVTELRIYIYGENNNDLSRLLLNMTKLKKFSIRILHPKYFNDAIFQSANNTVESFEMSIRANNNYVCSTNFALMIQRFENLQTLNMISSKINNNFNIAIPTLRQSLKQLDIPDAIFFYENLHIEEFTKLEELQVSNVPQINNACILNYVTFLKNLTVLNVSDCRFIDDAGFSLISHFPKLVVLDVNSTSITDNALRSYVVLKHLQEFICSETNVTDIGVVGILQNSLKLIYLNVEHTGVTRFTLETASNILNTEPSNRVLEIVVSPVIATNVENLSEKIKVLLFP
ncbi:hypothetical protein HCN44_001070 [Aphidius gifuensis]|uniref:F-box domain-containing protein n=1 Tax=Aphidius gifuensis TaxID=684658 RepID=A0A834XKI7_APHGI|nr:hypothetical protein HCN44_001070 [Aphidius gifuensis]